MDIGYFFGSTKYNTTENPLSSGSILNLVPLISLFSACLLFSSQVKNTLLQNILISFIAYYMVDFQPGGRVVSSDQLVGD